MDRHHKLQPIFKKGRFYNYHENLSFQFKNIYFFIYSFCYEIYIFLRSIKNGKLRHPENPNYWIHKSDIVHKAIKPNITWIGHATFLIQIGNINIVTDPVFGNVTPLFPRIFEPGIAIKNLPKIDYVIISHNHRDHMDFNSLKILQNINSKIKFLVPFGDKQWFDYYKFGNTIESFWWEKHYFDIPHNNGNINFTFLPASHWSQRGILDQNKSLWGSWMIEYNNTNIYFAGDTAYSKHFSYISKNYSNIDIALMPVGPCEPRSKMCHAHISAEESGQAFIDLKATHFVPMHWGTFHFGIDYFDTPINRLNSWWKQNLTDLDNKFLHIVKFGQRITFEEIILRNNVYNSKEIVTKF